MGDNWPRPSIPNLTDHLLGIQGAFLDQIRGQIKDQWKIFPSLEGGQVTQQTIGVRLAWDEPPWAVLALGTPAILAHEQFIDSE